MEARCEEHVCGACVRTYIFSLLRKQRSFEQRLFFHRSSCWKKQEASVLNYQLLSPVNHFETLRLGRQCFEIHLTKNPTEIPLLPPLDQTVLCRIVRTVAGYRFSWRPREQRLRYIQLLTPPLSCQTASKLMFCFFLLLSVTKKISCLSKIRSDPNQYHRRFFHDLPLAFL